MNKVKRSLRDEMPVTAEFIDAVREVFGVDEINVQIRNGLAGGGTFWAQENGIEVGSRPKQGTSCEYQ